MSNLALEDYACAILRACRSEERADGCISDELDIEADGVTAEIHRRLRS